jgi:hypothetical protein
MARAAEQVTPIEWWTLDDLLEYLTLAPFRYEIDRALHEMQRAFSTGDLPLYFETDAIDGKLQSYEFDPFRFRTGYTLEFDYARQVVRVVSRRGELQWGRRDHKLIKQDALRIWRLRPPASQTAPRQLEGKAGLDPFKVDAGRAAPPKPLSTIAWITAEARQLKADGKITEGMSKTELANLLARQSEGAHKAGKLKKPLTLRYIRNQLAAWDLWPISSIK